MPFIKYSPLPASGSMHNPPSRVWIHWICHLLGIVAISFSLHFGQRQKSCFDEYNYYSPANDALASYPYVEIRFNGSLWFPSDFKGPPSDKTAAAWKSVLNTGIFAIQSSDLLAIGHNLTTKVQFPPEAGGGYVSTTVGKHQLHCLHYIWQDHHREYLPEVLDKVRDIPDMYERHYEHCIDYIRQSLTCNYDMGLVVYDWVLQHQEPTPNSNARHKCANMDLVEGWHKKHAVEIPEDFVWRQPEGQSSLPWNP